MSADWKGEKNPGFKHGHFNTPEHRSWKHMIRRCYDKNDIRFPIYGAKGITVCDEWRNDFEKFLSDMGPKPSGFTIHRLRNDQNYCASNCVWSDQQTQQRNRSNNRLIKAFGHTLTLSDWAEFSGISISTLWARINRGWPASRAILRPVRRISV